MTRVIFRKYKDGDITALFPDEIADPRGNILSYMHVGQHGAADYHYVISKTKPATPEEYKPLLDELINLVGYDDLMIRKRWVRYRSD